MISERGTQAAPVRPLTALTLGVGGACAMALIGLGGWMVAWGSYPLAFGIDVTGERPYPFPWPEAVAIGVLLTILGVGVAIAVAARAGKAAGARRFAVAGIVGIVVASGVLAISSSEERRCALVAYSGTTHCISKAAAAARGFSIVAGPAAVVLVGLAVPRPRRSTSQLQPSGG